MENLANPQEDKKDQVSNLPKGTVKNIQMETAPGSLYAERFVDGSPESSNPVQGHGNTAAGSMSTSTTISNALQILKLNTDLDIRVEGKSKWDKRVKEYVQRFSRLKAEGKKLEFFPQRSGVLGVHQSLAMSDAFFELKDYRSCLEVLARLAITSPDPLGSQDCAFDIFVPFVYFDWTFQWHRVKLECDAVKNITMFDCLESEQKLKPLLATALRLEINTYFCTRHVFPVALITAGEQLEDHSKSPTDTAIGLLSQAVGFWFGDAQMETFCVQACQTALGVLNMAAADEVENPLLAVMTGVAKAWLGFTYLRTLQTRVTNEFSTFIETDKQKNPDRYKKRSDQEKRQRVVPAISSVNIRNESLVATNLILCIDALFTMVKFEETIVKEWVDEICPGLIMTTARLCALQISAYGDNYNSIRAWHVVNVLARIYKRKYIQLLSGMEIYKSVPLLNNEAVDLLDQLNEEGKSVKHVNSFYLIRFNLTRAIALYKNKMYQEGIDSLSEVLRINISKTAAHYLLRAESYFVLAEYQMLPDDKKPDFKLISSSLSAMTPMGLVQKGLRSFGNLGRKVDIFQSGWSDVYHNAYLRIVQMTWIPRGVQILFQGGRILEARSYGADAVFLCQRECLISRTVEILMLIAEIEIPCQKFDSCIEKADAIDKILSVEVCRDQNVVDPTVEELTEQLGHLEIKLDDPEILLHCWTQQWHVLPVDLPDYHYPCEKDRGRKEEFKDNTYKDKKYGLPKLFNHPLPCACYTCLSPILIPVSLRFLLLQAKLTAAKSKTEKPIRLINLTRHHQQRGMLRLLHSKQEMIFELSEAFESEDAASSAWEMMYLPLFYQFSVDSLHTQMEVTSASNLSDKINCYKHLKEGVALLSDADPLQALKSMEVLASAVMESTFLSGDILIRHSNLRDDIKNEFKAESEVVNGDNPTATTATAEATVPDLVPAAEPRSKRIKLKK